MKIWDEYNWKFWDPSADPITAPTIFNKVSICTTCMDRTHDLAKTLPQNLADNVDYHNVEFVVLNYNSKDNLDDYIKANHMSDIESGRLVYYKTTEPEFYDMGHSRNVAFKLASGDIVNNVDADNYTRKSFASLLNNLANLQPEKAVFCKGKRGMHGRLGLFKSEFLDLGGYDEELVGYGFDDHNLLYRAMNQGYKMMWWNDLCPMDRLRTPGSEKGKNMKFQEWRKPEDINKKMTMEKIDKGFKVANVGSEWGKATVIKNFGEEIQV